MNLLIDIGNTNLCWASQHGLTMGPPHSVLHSGAAPLDLLAAWDALEAPQRVLIGNVGGESVGTAVARVVRALWRLDPEFISTRAECLGVRVAYREPSRLGVDRWLSLLAAHGRQSGAALIVDAGTAVTYDLLLEDGTHLGGLILPGIEMMRAGLLTGTRIPRPVSHASGGQGMVEINVAEPWADDTETAVSLGSVQALGALADRLYDRLMERAQESSPALLLTGGDASRLARTISRPCEFVPDLVLRGLVRLAEESP